jgi:FKBP-type peptidyl-prolyl cis-trans isomerase
MLALHVQDVEFFSGPAHVFVFSFSLQSNKNCNSMKLIACTLLCLIATAGWGQSKKELVAEVARLKTEIENLKKPKEVLLKNEHQRASYGIGVIMATNLKGQGGDSLDIEVLSEAIKDFYQNKTLKMSQQECGPVVQQYMQMAMERKTEGLKQENQIFLDKNKLAEGVKTTSSGLQYKVISSGNGKAPVATDNVTVHYTGKLIDGTEFDSSVRRGQPATFSLNRVIQGWVEALQLMHEGDKWMVYIPYTIGYGERGNGSQIPPYSTLVFELELIKVN